MTEKIQKCWKSLNHTIILNQRELVLGVAACTLAGFVAGMLLSPRKNVTIGSNNSGNGAVVNANAGAEDAEEAEEEEEA